MTLKEGVALAVAVPAAPSRVAEVDREGEGVKDSDTVPVAEALVEWEREAVPQALAVAPEGEGLRAGVAVGVEEAQGVGVAPLGVGVGTALGVEVLLPPHVMLMVDRAEGDALGVIVPDTLALRVDDAEGQVEAVGEWHGVAEVHGVGVGVALWDSVEKRVAEVQAEPEGLPDAVPCATPPPPSDAFLYTP